MAQQSHIGTTATTVSTGEDGKTRVTYHNTNVVTFDADEIVLNHGGYMTATTKTRMNQASNQFNLGFKVFQKKGDWFVEYKGNIRAYGAGPAHKWGDTRPLSADPWDNENHIIAKRLKANRGA